MPVIETAASEQADGPSWFEDITERSRVSFVHDPGDVSKYFMYQCVGSGCAISDLDGDGRADLLLLTNAGALSSSTNKLFKQKSDGIFEDVSKGSGLDFPGLNMGIAIGDVNNDGKPDVLITQVNSTKLFLNLGNMKFQDVTVDAGIANPMWGTSAAFFDYDRDGWLDVFIVNYVDYDPSWPCFSSTGEKDYCAPKVFHGTSSKLFRNLGGMKELSKPRFEDVTVSSHVGDKPGPGLGIAILDCNNDGWLDVFVANDGKPNHLWVNNKNGTFSEEALSRGAACTMSSHAFAGMGVALGDVDNDGLTDFYVTHLTSETNTLWKQGPAGQFRDVSPEWGLTTTRWRGTGFGTLMADFNLDGFLDLAIANGRVSRESVAKKKPTLSPHWEPYGERNQLFAHNGNGKYQDVSVNNPAFCGYFNVARGLACGDIDGDGAPDLLINAIGEKARVFRNTAPNRGHWISIKAIDPLLNRDAIGAEIRVIFGKERRIRMIASSDSFLSAGPLEAHFGLGSTNTLDAIEVRWPDGVIERFPGGTVNRRIELRKGTGTKP